MPLRTILQWPRNTAIGMIGLYQATLSPDHGPLRGLYPHGYCRHEPTCSEYGKLVINEKGLLIGSALLLKRILSCNPWSRLSEKKILKIMSNDLPSKQL